MLTHSLIQLLNDAGATPAANTTPDSWNPNAPAVPPPAMGSLATQWIGYVKFFGMVAGIIGLMFCGIMMILGVRDRHRLASQGAVGIGWGVLGLLTIVCAGGIVTAIVV